MYDFNPAQIEPENHKGIMLLVLLWNPPEGDTMHAQQINFLYAHYVCIVDLNL